MNKIPKFEDIAWNGGPEIDNRSAAWRARAIRSRPSSPRYGFSDRSATIYSERGSAGRDMERRFVIFGKRNLGTRNPIRKRDPISKPVTP